jgi:hypothetical protein
MTGGSFRGRALGNAANHADIDADIQIADLASPIMGKVLLFTERHEGAKPTMAIKHEVTPQLSPVLMKLGRSYSPIRSKSLYHFVLSGTNYFSSEFNRRVYIWEDDVWTVKGRFNTVIDDDETVSWVQQSDGKLVLQLSIVSLSWLFCSMFLMYSSSRIMKMTSLCQQVLTNHIL